MIVIRKESKYNGPQISNFTCTEQPKSNQVEGFVMTLLYSTNTIILRFDLRTNVYQYSTVHVVSHTALSILEVPRSVSDESGEISSFTVAFAIERCKRRAQPTFPPFSAMTSGFWRSRSSRKGSAWWSRSSFTHSAWPPSAAKCSGVMLRSSWTFGSAPAAKSNLA